MTISSLDLQLALISNDRRVAAGLQRYFDRLGARASSTSDLDEAPSSTRGADAVVLFADDYPEKNPLGILAGLSAKVVVVVTSDVAAFRQAVAGTSLRSKVVVLPRPAWGWMVLDAVRACLQ